MYRNYYETQQRCCLICLKPLKPCNVAQLISTPLICSQCQSQFKIIDYKTSLNGHPLTILYEYNDFFKKLLYQYKGLYDYELYQAFLLCYPEIKKKYQDYYVAPAPSDPSTNGIRGFVPNVAIARTFSSHIFTGLYKKKPYKQSNQRYSKRKEVKKVIDIKGGAFLRRKKVLVFDDVITSSNTLLRCIELIERYQPSCIECLVLSTRSFVKGR